MEAPGYPRRRACPTYPPSSEQAPIHPSLSHDGRFVAFASSQTDLVEVDTEGQSHIYVRDRTNDTIEIVSKSSDGELANQYSWYPSLSADGRYVLFTSRATNLAGADGNDYMWDLIRHDRLTGTTVRASVSSAGEPADADIMFAQLSGDGRYAVFTSRATNLVDGNADGDRDLYLHDFDTAETTLLIDRDLARASAISADGQFVVFSCSSSTLVPQDDNWSGDAFVLDRDSGTIERVSVDSEGQDAYGTSHAKGISDDGRFVYFDSMAPLAPDDDNGTRDVYLRDRLLGTTTRLPLPAAPAATSATARAVSADGRFVAMMIASNHNFQPHDLAIYDREADASYSVIGATSLGEIQTKTHTAMSADGSMLSTSLLDFAVGGETFQGTHLFTLPNPLMCM